MDELPENWQRFGEWMQKKRTTLGLSQEAAAEIAGIHRQQWYRIEKGASTKRSTVISIASALNADPDVALSVAFGAITPPSADHSQIDQLTDELADLSRTFLRLNPDRRKIVLIVAQALSEIDPPSDESIDDEIGRGEKVPVDDSKYRDETSIRARPPAKSPR